MDLRSYLDVSGREDALSGGVRMVPVDTPSGTFRVWTKRVGNNPSLRLLLLHGGPGATHDTMDPAALAEMAEALPQGRLLHCQHGSHMSMYDDQRTYMHGLIDVLHDPRGGPRSAGG